MRSAIFAAISALALGVAAAPSSIYARAGNDCMDDAAALKVANNFKDLISETLSTSLAKSALTSDFHDYSDSVNELINAGNKKGSACYVQPLGSATFTSRAAFIKGQGAAGPIPFQILKTWHTCDTVFIRWRSSAPGTITPEQEVTGIIVLEAVDSGSAANPWQIETVYSEFNSGAFLYDVGNFTPSCNASGDPTKRSLPLF